MVCRIVGGFVFPVVSGGRSWIAGTFGGGSGGLTPRNVCRNHFARVTGEVRAAFDVTVSSAPFPRRPRRISRSGHSVTGRHYGPYLFGMPWRVAGRSFTLGDPALTASTTVRSLRPIRPDA